MENKKPSIAKLWQDVKKYKRVYYKVLPATFVVAAVLTLSIPNYYNCTVMLAPELSGSSSGQSSLASLASSFGIKLGTGNTGSEALFPTLYPDLMNSVAFRTTLFPVLVQREEDNEEGENVGVMTYYDYLKDGQKSTWWSAAIKWVTESIGDAIKSLFGLEEEESGKVNPFKLTKEQYEIVKAMEKTVVCDVDKKTLVITIDVKDQDPLIAATMADSVMVRLQGFITDYRTSKARVDLEYNKKLYAEAKERYEKALKRYANFKDANQKIFLERVRSQQTELQNEVQIQYQAFIQVAAQLQMAEAKVQEDTPAFTTLQPATVPVKKSGPKRARTCLMLVFLAMICVTAWAWHQEGDLIPLFSSDDEDEGTEA